ncbi:hypothetical protein [Amycolatopsis suaedae]|uniref:DUF3995 domain-containing protein n=1 Tax=Amycolatopsis suaedae TaxID=2510978 RepID=A0A4V2EME5_9PSEU|nr:hypothetical protein [Amycolatopsis suaedae]RZQ64785.1 hypothetical protein EWH70_07815 [Amycolatopsis suaedae]
MTTTLGAQLAVAYAAPLFSLVYGLLGLVWALGGPGFPFGDQRAPDGMSFFVGATPEAMGPVIAAVGLAGGVAGLLMARAVRGGRPVLLAVAAVQAVALLLVLPDIRILQNFAYLFFGYFGLIDWPVVNMALCIAGGVLWTAAAVVYRQSTSDTCAGCGRVPARWTSPAAAARWGRWAAYAGAACALPYGLVRTYWGIELALGLDNGEVGRTVPHVLMLFVLGGLPLGGAVLTIGLTRRWGEVWPRWVPFLRGRRVPLWFPVTLGSWAAIIVTLSGLKFDVLAVRAIADGTATLNWSGGPGLAFLPWGVAVGVATLGYYLRRRKPCAACASAGGGEPFVHGGPAGLGQATP